MQSNEDFIEKAILGTSQRDDNFWRIIDEIIDNEELKIKFIKAFQDLSSKFSKQNMVATIGLVNDIVSTLEKSLPELYQTILNLMYGDISYNYSLCYRFADLLIKLKMGNTQEVFDDIIYMVKKKENLTIRISVCALYGNFNFDDLSYNSVTTFIDEIYNYLYNHRDDENLKRDIKNFLLEKVLNSKYNSYSVKFEEIMQ